MHGVRNRDETHLGTGAFVVPRFGFKLSRLARVLAAALLVLILTAQPASAHAYLVRSDPAPNALVATGPKAVTLWFDEAVDPSYSTIEVVDSNQAHVEAGTASTVPGDPRQLTIGLKPVGDGTYSVLWKALSATDGHVTRGLYAFSVGAASPGAGLRAPEQQAVEGESDAVSIAARGLELLAILTLVGAIVLRELVLRLAPGEVDEEPRVLQRWFQVCAAALALALIGEAARLVLQARLATGAADPGQLAQVLFDTRLGTLWITRWVALSVLGVLVIRVRTRVAVVIALAEASVLFVLYTGILADPALVGRLGELWSALNRVGIAAHLVHIAPLFLFVLAIVLHDAATRRFVTIALALGVLLTLALESHGAADGDLSLAVGADWLHLCAVSAWIGGLITLVWIAVGASFGERWPARVARFSRLALASVVVIALTGVYSARFEIPSLGALLQTQYGLVLDAKVVVFAILTAIGSVQLFYMRRRIASARTPDERAGAQSDFRRLVSAEASWGVVAIGLAGLLTLLPPARAQLPTPPAVEQPAEPQGVPAAPAEPGVLVLYGRPDADLNISLRIAIADDRQQRFEVAADGGNDQPVTGILRVFLEFAWLERDTGTERAIADPAADGHFAATGAYLTQPGMWRIQVVVRRAGRQDVSSVFPYYVARPAVASGANDPDAVDWLRRSDGVMNRLSTLRSTQELNDGANAVVVTDLAYAAPDRVDMRIAGQGESIAIGGTQFYETNGVWTDQPRVQPFVFPNFANAATLADARLGRGEIVDGKPMQIVLATEPGPPDAYFAYWIGTDDHAVHQLVMVAPAHFMLQRYIDFDAPIVIQPPIK